MEKFSHCLITYYYITWETLCKTLNNNNHKISITNSNLCTFVMFTCKFNASLFSRTQSERYQPKTSLDKPSCWLLNRERFKKNYAAMIQFSFEHSAQILTH